MGLHECTGSAEPSLVDFIYFSGIKWRKVFSIAECKLKVFFMTNKEVLSSTIHCTCTTWYGPGREKPRLRDFRFQTRLLSYSD